MSTKNEKDTVPCGCSTKEAKTCHKISQKVEEKLQEDCKATSNYLAECCDCRNDEGLIKIRHHNDGHLLNTGSNGAGGVITAPGTDLNWEFGPSLTGPWTPAFVTGNPIPGSWNGTPPANAEWISIDSDAKVPGNVTSFLRLRFVLCPNINPAEFRLTTSFLIDDTLQEVYVNGVAQSTHGTIPSGGFTGAATNLNLNHDWQSCENEIIFELNTVMTYVGFIAGFSIAPMQYQQNNCNCRCETAKLPDVSPCFSISWSKNDSKCIKTDDFEVLCIKACNCYDNLCFEDLTIHQITVCDENGRPVPNLPDGRPSVEIVPFGPICFGDLGPCQSREKPSCKYRQVAIRTNGAKEGYYRIKLEGICYRVAYTVLEEACFEFKLCED